MLLQTKIDLHVNKGKGMISFDIYAFSSSPSRFIHTTYMLIKMNYIHHKALRKTRAKPKLSCPSLEVQFCRY